MTTSGLTLFGRDAELAAIRAFLTGDAAASGGALLLWGDLGAGKTALLNAAATMAAVSGARVLRMTSAAAERSIAFACLHQFLLPFHTPGESGVLDRILGFTAGPVPPHEQVVAAVRARIGPVVVIGDNMQWADPQSAAVVRELTQDAAGTRIRYLGAVRAADESRVAGLGVPLLELKALATDAADRLLIRRHPDLAARTRRRIVELARGNPLALVELPAGLTAAQRAGAEPVPESPALSPWLRTHLNQRLRRLPEDTRRLLLAAALAREPEAAPPVRSALIGPDRRFRHPLTAAALVAGSTAMERRDLHLELAAALVDRPDRMEERALHLADAASGPDEEVAGLLDQVARRAFRRGEISAGAGALVRAAELSGDSDQRVHRMAAAAFHLQDGDLRHAARMLDFIRGEQPDARGALAATTATAAVLLNGEGDIETAHALLTRAIDEYADNTDPTDRTLIDALDTLRTVCWFGGQPRLWTSYRATVGRLDPGPPPCLWLADATNSDPARTPPEALRALSTAIERMATEDDDPVHIIRIAVAAYACDGIEPLRPALTRVAERGRQGHGVVSALNALQMLAFDDFKTGDWSACRAHAGESLRMCEYGGFGTYSWSARYLLALVAAGSGDDAVAAGQLRHMLRWALPRGVFAAQAHAAHVHALAAGGAGDFEAAYRYAVSISPAGELARNEPSALAVPLDVVESAVRTGRHEEARGHADALDGLERISSRLGLLQYAAAGVAGEGERAFEAALAVPGAARWRFDYARVQLCYGSYLRRNLAVVASRGPLSQALEAFERIGAKPWAARARTELAATAANRVPANLGQALTPQELQVATLAASGLSNKRIAEQLFVSPRTVSNHLYQAFPKLGITTRAALRDALTKAGSQ